MKKTQFLEEAERMRKAKALSGKRKQKPGGCRTVAAAVLLVLSLLTGCSRERMETRREIERILEAAESVAEDRAAAHIFAPSVNPRFAQQAADSLFISYSLFYQSMLSYN